MSSNHGDYTHLGWTHKYENDKANWPVRKKLLQNTVNKVFDFGFFNEWFGKKSNQCESFCALIYYVHIAADHLYEGYKYDKHIIPFAVVGANEKSPDLFYELIYYLSILFEEQIDTYSYSAMMIALESLAIDARELQANYSDEYTSDEREEMFRVMKQSLMKDILEIYIPQLLKNTDFFNKAFY